MRKERSTLFDSVKGIAILGIMFIHLGQWNLDLQDGSRLAIIRSAGLLGVELTYLINAFFLTRHFDELSAENGHKYIYHKYIYIYIYIY